eukprot:gene15930-17531_t
MFRGVNSLRYTPRDRYFNYIIISSVFFAALNYRYLVFFFRGIPADSKVKVKPEEIVLKIPKYVDNPEKFETHKALITPDKLPDKLLFLILISTSSLDPIGPARRDAIRRTWGNCNGIELKSALIGARYSGKGSDDLMGYNHCRLIFYLGKTNDHDKNEQIRKEAHKHGDIIFVDAMEAYVNMTLKVRTCIKHVSEAKTQVKYIVKVDNDVHVNLPNLLEFLATDINLPLYLFGGIPKFNDPVLRRKSSRWCVKKEDYPEDIYPGYCMGFLYVLSGNLVGPLAKVFPHVKPFNADDAYMGIALDQLGVSPVRIPRLDRYEFCPALIGMLELCDFSRFIGIGDSLSPSDLFNIHEILVSSRSLPAWYCWNFFSMENFFFLSFIMICLVCVMKIITSTCFG